MKARRERPWMVFKCHANDFTYRYLFISWRMKFELNNIYILKSLIDGKDKISFSVLSHQQMSYPVCCQFYRKFDKEKE